MMNYNAFMASLGLQSPAEAEETAFWRLGREVWDAACADFEQDGCRWVTDDWLQALEADLDLFRRNRESVYRGAAMLREMPDLCRFILLLVHMLRADRKALREDGKWSLPAAPEGEDPLPYELTGFFAELALVPESAAILRGRHVPESVIRDTLCAFDGSISIFAGTRHRPGYDASRVRWTIHYLVPDILRIGRLEFEMRPFGGAVRAFTREDGTLCALAYDCRLHYTGSIPGAAGCVDEGWPGTPFAAFDADFKELPDGWEGYPIEDGKALRPRVKLSKDEWTPFLSPGDPVLSVHIPAFQPFDHERVLDAYHRARAIIGLCFPDFPYRAIVCASWLMDPMLDTLLEGKGNIVRFQRDFLRFPYPASGRGVYTFLFSMPKATPEELPADSTLRRRVRDLLLAGGHILELGGILKPTALY